MLSRVLRYCYEVSRNQWLSAGELEALQETRLRAILKHAYQNVPLYRSKFDKAGISPDDIHALEDLARIPFVTKTEIRAGFPDQSTARGYDMNRCVKMPTSGTSGGPMPVVLDKRYWDFVVANRYYRRTMALGFSPWDKIMEIEYRGPVHDATPANAGERGEPEKRSRGRAALGPSASLFRRWVRKSYIAYGANEIIEDMVKYRPRIVYATPSYLRLLAEALTDQGVENVRPDALVATGEVFDEPTREFLEDTLGCEAFTSYGINEVQSISWECKRKEGQHITADSVVLEVVRDGETVGPGEEGELVLTGLISRAMPLIRYRTGDIGVLDESKCSCGRTLPLLKSVEGRIVDCFTLPNGRTVTPKTVQTAIQGTAGVSRYQAVQEDEMKVKIELMRKESDAEVSISELVARCHDVLGDDVEIEVSVGDRSNLRAKFRPVISKLTVAGEARWTIPRG